MLTPKARSTWAVEPWAVTNRLFFGTSMTLKPWSSSQVRTSATSERAGA